MTQSRKKRKTFQPTRHSRPSVRQKGLQELEIEISNACWQAHASIRNIKPNSGVTMSKMPATVKRAQADGSLAARSDSSSWCSQQPNAKVGAGQHVSSNLDRKCICDEFEEALEIGLQISIKRRKLQADRKIFKQIIGAIRW